MPNATDILTARRVPQPGDPAFHIKHTQDEWRQQLSPNRYRILFEAATEPPFNNALYAESRPGLYLCAAGGTPLFHSADKFDSGSGWPSFTKPIAPWLVEHVPDHSHGMQRVEVRCARTGAHLGHVFEDGPAPDGLRYCINSAALEFVADAG